MVLILKSCGGTIGSIERYRYYNGSADSLVQYLDALYIKYPNNLHRRPTSRREGCFKYLLLHGQNKDSLTFTCCVNGVDSFPPHISLVYAGQAGKKQKTRSDIGFWEKRKYCRIFEDSILSRLNKKYVKGAY
jgi:hypothetical protein